MVREKDDAWGVQEMTLEEISEGSILNIIFGFLKYSTEFNTKCQNLK
jgi:hypothetical protein